MIVVSKSVLSFIGQLRGAKSYAPFLPAEGAQQARLVGDEASRHCELRAAHGLFTGIDVPIRVAEVAKELAR
jgi:hypothetical protein